MSAGTGQNQIMTHNKDGHPIVGDHAPEWYQNWLTCTVCNTWVGVLKGLMTDVKYIKAAKGLLWLFCAT